MESTIPYFWKVRFCTFGKYEFVLLESTIPYFWKVRFRTFGKYEFVLSESTVTTQQWHSYW